MLVDERSANAIAGQEHANANAIAVALRKARDRTAGTLTRPAPDEQFSTVPPGEVDEGGGERRDPASRALKLRHFVDS